MTHRAEMSDWMNAIQSPPSWKIHSTSIHLKKRQLYITIIVVVLVIVVILYMKSDPNCKKTTYSDLGVFYNATYPLSRRKKMSDGFSYPIGLVADLDTESRNKSAQFTWFSYFRSGEIIVNAKRSNVKVKFSPIQYTLTSQIGFKGRGMELSELVIFNGKVYTCDDRTGIVYEIYKMNMIPWVILADGNGRNIKGFKCEWAAVKDGHLYVGGLGKEWTTRGGELVNLNPQWVKRISPTGAVEHLDWHDNYSAMRRAAGFNYPGYMIHEAAFWSNFHQRWFFLPRRASKQRYDEKADEFRGTNILLTCEENFNEIEVRHIGPFSPVRGFSSFKFLPNNNDHIIVALKSEEERGKIASYIVAFDLDGNVLMKEKKLDGYLKFEGIEFL